MIRLAGAVVFWEDHRVKCHPLCVTRLIYMAFVIWVPIIVCVWNVSSEVKKHGVMAIIEGLTQAGGQPPSPWHPHGTVGWAWTGCAYAISPPQHPICTDSCGHVHGSWGPGPALAGIRNLPNSGSLLSQHRRSKSGTFWVHAHCLAQACSAGKCALQSAGLGGTYGKTCFPQGSSDICDLCPKWAACPGFRPHQQLKSQGCLKGQPFS